MAMSESKRSINVEFKSIMFFEIIFPFVYTDSTRILEFDIIGNVSRSISFILIIIAKLTALGFISSINFHF